MRRELIFTAVAAAIAAASVAVPRRAAAVTAAEAFAKAPAAVFPTVDSLTRLDMIDYFNSGSAKASRNLLRGDCRVTAVSDARLDFESSDISTHSIELLPAAKGDTVVMLISTMRTPAEDSRVRFFTTSWRELPGMMDSAGLADWLTPEGRRDRVDVENAVPFILATATYDPATSILTLACDPAAYLPKEGADVAEKGLKRTLSFRWDGKRMKLMK